MKSPSIENTMRFTLMNVVGDPYWVTTVVIGVIGWVLAIIGSVSANYTDEDTFPIFSWWVLAFEVVSVFFALYAGIVDETEMYGTAVTGFLSIATVYTSTTVNALIYRSTWATGMAAAGYILQSIANLLLILLMGTTKDEPMHKSIRQIAAPKRPSKRTFMQVSKQEFGAPGGVKRTQIQGNIVQAPPTNNQARTQRAHQRTTTPPTNQQRSRNQTSTPLQSPMEAPTQFRTPNQTSEQTMPQVAAHAPQISTELPTPVKPSSLFNDPLQHSLPHTPPRTPPNKSTANRFSEASQGIADQSSVHRGPVGDPVGDPVSDRGGSQSEDHARAHSLNAHLTPQSPQAQFMRSSTTSSKPSMGTSALEDQLYPNPPFKSNSNLIRETDGLYRTHSRRDTASNSQSSVGELFQQAEIASTDSVRTEYRVRALESYDADENDSEIPFVKGEIMSAYDISSQWWYCKKADGRHGICPRNYLQLIDETE